MMLMLSDFTDLRQICRFEGFEEARVGFLERGQFFSGILRQLLPCC